MVSVTVATVTVAVTVKAVTVTAMVLMFESAESKPRLPSYLPMRFCVPLDFSFCASFV